MCGQHQEDLLLRAMAVLYMNATVNGIIKPLLAVSLLDTTPADVTATSVVIHSLCRLQQLVFIHQVQELTARLITFNKLQIK
jgi:hypothetical protein